MGKSCFVPLYHRQGLNQALIWAARVPARACLRPGTLVRALRMTLRMSQEQLSRRCGLPQAHIARLEAGRLDPRFSTLARLLDAMFCGALLLPRALKRPSDAVAEREVEAPREPRRRIRRLWPGRRAAGRQ